MLFSGLLTAPAAVANTGEALLGQASDIAQQTPDTLTESDDNSEDEKKDEDDEKSKKPKVKTIAEFLKEKEKIDGLFPFYRDTKTGAVFMEVSADQLEQEFIYFTYVHNGVGGLIGTLAGLRSAGDINDNFVFSLRRRFGNIDIVQRDTQYGYDEESALQKGGKVNVLTPVLATMNIVAKNKTEDRFIISVSGLFKGKDLFRIGDAHPLAALVGLTVSLDKKKTNIQSVRNYSDNSEIITEYVFDFKKGPQAASVLLQHNFVRMPKPGFQPRLDDPRVGFFAKKKTNLSETDDLPYEDKIHRWRLVKKNPGAAMSEPVKPITYWIQNTTPPEYRNVIKKAILRWNSVFESAGFKNAIVVRIQPDDATWDAGDVRYNVVQWIASPNPKYNGYGPSIVNPRTGEIIGADIVLEHNSIRKNLLFDSLIGDGIAAPANGEHDFANCSFADALSRSNAFAQLAGLLNNKNAGSIDAADLDKIVLDGLYYLVMHEVGHTLGLTHNMRASHYKSLAELRAITDTIGDNVISASVMDYPAVNIAPEGVSQGPYYPTAPGAYDYWAIAYGYDARMDDAGVRGAHLAKSGLPGLGYGNDADDMRSVGRGIDPRIIPYDMSSEPMKFAAEQIALITDIQSSLLEKLSKPGESWDRILRAQNLLMRLYRQHITGISRYIGGVYVDRSFAGQEGAATAPFTPVPLEKQQFAMAMLNKYVFAPEAFDFPEDLLSHLQEQRRGFSGTRDPRIHSEIGSLQAGILAHLTHKNTLSRMVDSGLYGNSYDVHTMLDDLTNAIFKQDLGGPINSLRQNLQVIYTKHLIKKIAGTSMDNVSISAIYSQILDIDKIMGRGTKRADNRTKSHRRYLRQLIADALEHN